MMFKKAHNLKIVATIISVVFLCNTSLYSCPVSEDNLRVPVGTAYQRIMRVMQEKGTASAQAGGRAGRERARTVVADKGKNLIRLLDQLEAKHFKLLEENKELLGVLWGTKPAFYTYRKVDADKVALFRDIVSIAKTLEIDLHMAIDTRGYIVIYSLEQVVETLRENRECIMSNGELISFKIVRDGSDWRLSRKPHLKAEDREHLELVIKLITTDEEVFPTGKILQALNTYLTEIAMGDHTIKAIICGMAKELAVYGPIAFQCSQHTVQVIEEKQIPGFGSVETKVLVPRRFVSPARGVLLIMNDIAGVHWSNLEEAKAAITKAAYEYIERQSSMIKEVWPIVEGIRLGVRAGGLSLISSRRQHVDHENEIVAVPADKALDNEPEFIQFVSDQPQEHAVVLIARTREEYDKAVERFGNLVWVKILDTPSKNLEGIPEEMIMRGIVWDDIMKSVGPIKTGIFDNFNVGQLDKRIDRKVIEAIASGV